MLQQTRVAAVIEHYQEFLRRFPTVKKLAAAREASVLAAWSGLGYYRRARMLHAAAKVVVARVWREVSDDRRSLARPAGSRTLHCGGNRQHRLRRTGRPWSTATSSACCSEYQERGWPEKSCGKPLTLFWMPSVPAISIRR